MKNTQINLSELLGLGREMARNKRKGLTLLWICLVIFGIVVCGAFGIGTIIRFFHLEESHAGAFMELFGNVIGFLLGIMMLVMYFGWARKEDLKFRDFWQFPQRSLLGNMLVAGVLYFVIVVIGLVLFVLPGMFFATRFIFFKYAIIDKNLGPIDALKYSWKITKGHFWRVLGYTIVFSLISTVGLLAVGVGVFWTIAMTQIATAALYRKLSEIADADQQPSLD